MTADAVCAGQGHEAPARGLTGAPGACSARADREGAGSIRGVEAARRALAPSALAVASLALVAGCSATNPYTTLEGYQPGDTEVVNLGPVQVASLAVFTEAEGEPGALVARIVNSAPDEQSVTITSEAPSSVDETFTVQGETTLAVGPDEDTSTTIASVAERPGETITMTVTTGDRSSEVTVPVLTGNFQEYATLVPTATPTPTAPSATPSDSPSSAGGVTPSEPGPVVTGDGAQSPTTGSTPRTLSPSGSATG